MERAERLRKLVADLPEDKRTAVESLIDDLLFLEGQLRYLRTLPLIRVSRQNPEKQEVTPAGRLYKDYLGSYTNAVKVILTTSFRAGDEGESPLAKALAEFEAEDDG